MAAFSSRGPALAGDGDLLKPDILAPGVDVIAGFSPANNGRDYDFLSGTSMSSPHIAGLAALLIQKHPRWSPMMIKSALLTTASVKDNKGAPISKDSGEVANALDYGSGQVNVNGAANPGLVYDSTSTDWIRWLCGTGQLAATGPNCTATGSIDPSDLNQANIAIGALAGRQTVTRTVTNVSTLPGIYLPQGRRAGRRLGLRHAQGPARQAERQGDLPGHPHPHHRGLRPVRLRIADLDQRAVLGP